MIHQIFKSITPAMLIILATTIFSIYPASSLAFNEVNKTSFGVAIKGYDTVAYHTEGRAVKGDSKFYYDWNDASWYFSSAANRNLFAADPERYSPRYGGY